MRQKLILMLLQKYQSAFIYQKVMYCFQALEQSAVPIFAMKHHPTGISVNQYFASHQMN